MDSEGVKWEVLTKRGANKQLLGRHVSIDEVSAQESTYNLLIGSLRTIQRRLPVITMTMITVFNCNWVTTEGNSKNLLSIFKFFKFVKTRYHQQSFCD